MDLKVFNLKNLKRTYFSFLSLCVIVVGVSFVLYKMGVQVFPLSPLIIKLKNVLLFGMIGVAFVFSMYEASQRGKLQALPTVDEKIIFYENFYFKRLWWYVLACAVSGFLLLLTFRLLFISFCLFDLMMMLIAWPTEFKLKQEMKEDELIFVK